MMTKIQAVALVVSAVVGGTTGYLVGNTLTHKMQERHRMTWPDAGPSEIFGQCLLPEPVKCPVVVPPETREPFLTQFVRSLELGGARPREVGDVLTRAYIESRLQHSLVSKSGDWGICQINAGAWPGIDVTRLLTDAGYAAEVCLSVYRASVKNCGRNWQCCYRHGKAGCRKRGGK